MTVTSEAHHDTYAAVDLGSNSFHMLVARREHGEMRVLDRIKEMVRLGGGLDADGNLDARVEQRALACLSRFGQRLRGIPAENLRAVGTQTFRRLANADEFLLAAEQALDCPVDIIAGREEARLVYLGVTQWVAGDRKKKLVMDIGGGSTEFIIGDGIEPLERESLQFGCVSITRRFFGNGKISQRRLRKARRSVLGELQALQSTYRQRGWQIAIGSSGTVKSTAAICQANGWSENSITRQALQELKRRALSFKTTDAVQLDGLSERRQPVFMGGLAILLACFKALEIEELVVSPYALREGLLQDLLGRLEDRDPRDKAVKALMSRFAVDMAQVARVRTTTLRLFDQLSAGHHLSQTYRLMLSWAAGLHEIGLGLSHTSYHQHSAYLVSASDMAGFTRQEQLFLAALVGYQRREIPRSYAAKLPPRLQAALRICLACMRLAWIFCRSREDEAIPTARLTQDDTRLQLVLPQDWAREHPLTIADLEFEQQALPATGLQLHISYE